MLYFSSQDNTCVPWDTVVEITILGYNVEKGIQGQSEFQFALEFAVSFAE